MALAKYAEDNMEIRQERLRYCTWTSRNNEGERPKTVKQSSIPMPYNPLRKSVARS